MKVQVKRSTVAGKAPANGTLEAGELAVNVVDGKIFTGDATKQTIELGGGGSVPVDLVTSSADATSNEVRISEMVSLTQAEYNALATKQVDKLYIITV